MRWRIVNTNSLDWRWLNIIITCPTLASVFTKIKPEINSYYHINLREPKWFLFVRYGIMVRVKRSLCQSKLWAELYNEPVFTSKLRNNSVLPLLSRRCMWKLYYYLAGHLAKTNRNLGEATSTARYAKFQLQLPVSMAALSHGTRPLRQWKLHWLVSVEFTVQVRRPKQSPKTNRKGRDHPESRISDIHDSPATWT